MNKQKRVMLTGSSGSVGTGLVKYLNDSYYLLTPSRRELDITSAKDVSAYIHDRKPDVIIHGAAITDNDAAEKERGNTKGLCYTVNVNGTKFIAEAAKNTGAYVIFLSTGSVFSGDSRHPGPFTESDPVSSEDALSWYGWTKKQAESFITGGAIIRLSRPVDRIGPFETDSKDYIHRFVTLYDRHALYPLFTDQLFPVTYIPDLVMAIKQLINGKRKGIFHVVSTDCTSPYELAKYAIEKARHVKPVLTKTSFDAFIRTAAQPKRFTKYSAIDGNVTRKNLSLPARTWREIVDDVLPVSVKA